jgi:hypothetical protein
MVLLKVKLSKNNLIIIEKKSVKIKDDKCKKYRLDVSNWIISNVGFQ